MDRENRVVVLIDMDCFYCQVEEKLNPELKGKPIAVVQYNPWKGGGIIAVNYVARDMGVTRHMRGDEAKEKCPEIQLPSVPCLRGKADISKYRDAGKDVARVLQKFTTLLERASIDEAYLDITAAVNVRLKTTNPNSITLSSVPNTYALGYDNIDGFLSDVQNCGSENIDFDYEHAKMLLVGAVIVSEIRAAVYDETGFRCSAGIAHNKILAKLVCGMNKPNKQTVLPKHSVNILYSTLPVKKVKHLGGKFGDSVCDALKISKMGELQRFTEKELQAKFDEKNGTWLYNIARGTDLEPVQARFNPKSIGCCKQFKGKNALLDYNSLNKWLKDLGLEIEDRLEKDALENNRTPKQMVVSFATQMADGRDASSSRSYNFVVDDELCGELLSVKSLELITESIDGVRWKDGDENRKLPMPIKFLGVSVGKFEDNSESKKTKKIVDFFSAGTSKDNTIVKENTKDKTNKENLETKHEVKSKKSDKDFIMQKFLQSATKTAESSIVKDSVNKPVITSIENDVSTNKPVLETSVEKQESFFAKYLNQNQERLKIENKNLNLVLSNRPVTPICKVIECGENSNDSTESGSTINNEINKSINLFEDDPIEVARVTKIRNLLHRTEPEREKIKTPEPTDVETFECSECNKTIPVFMVQTHADYHLALKLREEERQLARIDRESRQTVQTEPVKQDTKVQKCDPNTSIAGFLVKYNNEPIEICSQCKRKVPVDKYAEHLDFHEAQKLSRELNKKPVTLNSFTPNSVKRKRKSLSPEKKPKVMCKTIDSFFTR